MLRPDAFARSGTFYKGNLHTHSTLSDGLLSPEEVCRRYREAGYDFLCLSDHFIGEYGYPIADTAGFRTNSFTTVLGAEVHTGRMENGELWHMLAVGLPADFAPPHAPGFQPADGAESAAALAKRCRDAGAFVAIVHPQWSGLTLSDALGVDAAHAVEIYNHGCAIDSDRADGSAILDLLLSAGRRLTAIATDDAHFTTDVPAGRDHFGGWTMVRAEANEPEAIVAALKAGWHYSSQGPTLADVVVEDDRVVMTHSPAIRGNLMGPGSASAAAAHDAPTEETVIALDRLSSAPWLRASITDADGRRAWTNPIWRR